MTISEHIRDAIMAGLPVEHLTLENESHMHNVPPGSESHFRLVLVSSAFEGLPRVRRHQRLYALLGGEDLRLPVHALAMHLYMPEEWAATEAAPASPSCRGGDGTFSDRNQNS